MASIAFDSSGSRDEARPSISLHPAFPAIVALWFAALLGVGSMVLPAVLIERLIESTGISALVPAASPPLGVTARSLIALASAVAGAGIGIAVARRVARSHDAERPLRLFKGARRPIDVNEELGGEALVNGFGLPVSNHRALAIAEDDHDDDLLYMAPLPAGEDIDDALFFEDHSADFQTADEPFELLEVFEPTPEADEEIAMSLEPEFEVPSPAPLAFAEPLELAPTPEEPEPQPFRSEWSDARLEELGLVQLVQRLGASLERRRELLAVAATRAPLLTPAAGFEPAQAEEAAQAMADYFRKSAPRAFDPPINPAPAAPADADAALRAALATLQRMSGTA